MSKPIQESIQAPTITPHMMRWLQSLVPLRDWPVDTSESKLREYLAQRSLINKIETIHKKQIEGS